VEEVRDEKNERFARKTFSPGAQIPTDAHENLKKRFKRHDMGYVHRDFNPKNVLLHAT
jgi:aminoglycoside/choline kinase family phosphotransferase